MICKPPPAAAPASQTVPLTEVQSLIFDSFDEARQLGLEALGELIMMLGESHAERLRRLFDVYGRKLYRAETEMKARAVAAAAGTMAIGTRPRVNA